MNIILPDIDNETKARIFQSAKSEFIPHTWDTFVDNLPSIAEGGNGVVIPGCPACRERINANDQYFTTSIRRRTADYSAEGFRDCRRFGFEIVATISTDSVSIEYLFLLTAMHADR
jgi:hypothetical protein